MTTVEFNQHIISLQKRLKFFALKLTQNTNDAEDLLQETFLKAITYRNLFVRETNFTAWIYTIMKNTFINNYRKANRAKTTIDNSKDLYLLNLGMDYSVAPADSQYSLKEIQRNIDELKDEYRIPFTMYVDGHKYKEIADDLDLPIGTVKSRIFFARKFLMELLSEYKYKDVA